MRRESGQYVLRTRCHSPFAPQVMTQSEDTCGRGQVLLKVCLICLFYFFFIFCSYVFEK